MYEDTLVEADIRPVYVSAGATDVGLARSSNQDTFLDLPQSGIWAVADGMGGHRDGDVASRMVGEGLQGLDPLASLEDTIDSIRQRLSDVNHHLHQAAVRPVDPVVSGSTVALFVARRTSCAIVWAGDSRVYRLRHRRLSQLTTDHTWASEMNLQTPSETDHAITRAVGGEDTLLLDVRRDRVRLGDRYLLCSDGLTHELSDARIADILQAGADVHECVRALIQATLDAGARDNVTVVVVEAM